MIGATGCKHGPTDTINIPGMTRVGRPGDNLSSRPPINIGEQPPTVDENLKNSDGTTGFSEKGDKWSDLIGKPHNEDSEFFKNETVYFDTDSAAIKPSEQPKLEKIAAHFKENAVDCLTVEGYCDERGTEGYNLALGDRRSLAVREYLITLGVEAGRIHTVSFGEAKPVDPGHNEAAWKQNRRGVSVLISPK